MPLELTRRTLLFGAAAFIPTVCASVKQFQREAAADSAEQHLTAIESRLGGRLGVAALDMGDGRRIGQRSAERFPMCSTFKFLLVATVLSRVDAGGEKLGRSIHYRQADVLDYSPITKAHVQDGGMTVSALCAAAIEYSDNTAANLLLRAVGGPAAVTRHVRSLGDSVTRLDRYEPALNSAVPGDPRDTTSPSAMLDDMQTVLLENRALTVASRQQLDAWLVASTTGTERLRAGLPSTWRVGDKTGTGGNGAANDIAICWPPNRSPILIAAYFVGSKASDADRSAALAEVGRMVSARFS